MVTPAPVFGQTSSLQFSSELERTNYLSGGLIFSSAYDDNLIPYGSNRLVDVSYTVAPTIALRMTRRRLLWTLSYSPGYTFYQRYTAYNQAYQNLSTDLSLRLSPHFTFTAQELFSQSPMIEGQPNQFDTETGGVVQTPNQTIVAPIVDTLVDSTDVKMSYQFSPNGMVGLTGNVSELRYPKQDEISGIFNSNTVGGGAFYTHRLSGKHYVGATYQYQRYLASSSSLTVPTTETQSLLLFYTVYFKPTLSLSLSGGPQHADTYGAGVAPYQNWVPSAGGSLNWQGRHTSMMASYSRRITDGGGLEGAVRSNAADASIRRQLLRSLNGTIGAEYATNQVLDALPAYNANGHTITGNAALNKTWGEHVTATATYLRLHQDYSDPSLVSYFPNKDRVSLSIGYQFARPLGR